MLGCRRRMGPRPQDILNGLCTVNAHLFGSERNCITRNLPELVVRLGDSDGGADTYSQKTRLQGNDGKLHLQRAGADPTLLETCSPVSYSISLRSDGVPLPMPPDGSHPASFGLVARVSEANRCQMVGRNRAYHMSLACRAFRNVQESAGSASGLAQGPAWTPGPNCSMPSATPAPCGPFLRTGRITQSFLCGLAFIWRSANETAPSRCRLRVLR